MKVISFKKANCKNCYKCLRVCPVKSIKFNHEQAEIMEDQCILCGRCTEACPQNAKTIASNVDKVKTLINQGNKTVVSLAPSFLGSFEYDNPAQVVGALQRLGFSAVYETAEAAVSVTYDYLRQIKQKKGGVLIGTSCPTINEFVEKYYPEATPYLATTVSPMIAHGMMLKKQLGADTKVVFIGPCIAKKGEAFDMRNEGTVDAVMTFDEVARWMDEEGIDIKECALSRFSGENPQVARLYPLSHGVVSTLNNIMEENDIDVLNVDGIEECEELLKSVVSGKITNAFIEVNACRGGCINGPGRNKSLESQFETILKIKKFANSEEKLKAPEINIDLTKKFFDRSKKMEMPSEEKIREILKSIDKDTKDKELNCGCCGYATCRDKAIAVYNGKAEVSMCMPYMKEVATSLSNVVLANTPNLIIVTDNDLIIKDINNAAQKAFHTTRSRIVDDELLSLIPTENFKFVAESGVNIYDKKVEYPEYGIITKQTIINAPNRDIVVGIFRDISKEEQQNENMYNLKVDTIDMAQKVINKQMVVAQQIASLLGETTAETKVTLTKLKDAIVYNEENRQ